MKIIKFIITFTIVSTVGHLIGGYIYWDLLWWTGQGEWDIVSRIGYLLHCCIYPPVTYAISLDWQERAPSGLSEILPAHIEK